MRPVNMVDTAVGILKVSFEIYTEIKGVNDGIIANRKPVSLLTSRLGGVAEEANAIVESGDASGRKMEPARNYCTLYADGRDFLCQFTKHDRVAGLARKAFAWASKARNREAGQAALEDFLKRLDACSRDLDLRVTLGIKQSSQQLKEETASIITLLQEDGGETRDVLQEFCHAALQSQDDHARVQEAQFHLLQSATSELDIRLTSSSEGSTCGSTDSSSAKKGTGWCATLPALEQQRQRADVDHPHDPASDNGDASLGEEAFGEVFLLRGRFQDELFAVKLLKLRKGKNAGVSTETLRQEAANLRRLTHPNTIRTWAECQEDKGKFYGVVMEFAAGGPVHTHVQKAGGKTVPQSKRWFEELCAGLHHLHQECRTQHRDLKPQNLLLGDNGRLKIAYLGLVCACQTAQSLSKQGTSLCTSPGKASGQKHGTTDDTWAAG
jgi:hypothetical protein